MSINDDAFEIFYFHFQNIAMKYITRFRYSEFKKCLIVKKNNRLTCHQHLQPCCGHHVPRVPHPCRLSVIWRPLGHLPRRLSAARWSFQIPEIERTSQFIVFVCVSNAQKLSSAHNISPASLKFHTEVVVQSINSVLNHFDVDSKPHMHHYYVSV